jgi:hypothetical protein
MKTLRRAQLTLPLGGLFGQDVAPMGGVALDGTGGGALKALRGSAIGFNLGHFSLLRYLLMILMRQMTASVIDSSRRGER